jgi:hypothetical protein
MLFFLLEHIVTPISVEEWGVSYTDARKKVLEHHSGLCPSEKELVEQHSGGFHHKNTPKYHT